MPFFVNPNQAEKSGCTADDIELLKLLIPHAYEQNRSAIRPDVRIRHAWYIEHKSILGSCPEHLLLEALTPVKLGNPDEPSTSWTDYQDKTGLPEDRRRPTKRMSAVSAKGRENTRLRQNAIR